jgi:hypothetical protein
MNKTYTTFPRHLVRIVGGWSEWWSNKRLFWWLINNSTFHSFSLDAFKDPSEHTAEHKWAQEKKFKRPILNGKGNGSSRLPLLKFSTNIFSSKYRKGHFENSMNFLHVHGEPSLPSCGVIAILVFVIPDPSFLNRLNILWDMTLSPGCIVVVHSGGTSKVCCLCSKAEILKAESNVSCICHRCQNFTHEPEWRDKFRIAPQPMRRLKRHCPS